MPKKKGSGKGKKEPDSRVLQFPIAPKPLSPSGKVIKACDADLKRIKRSLARETEPSKFIDLQVELHEKLIQQKAAYMEFFKSIPRDSEIRQVPAIRSKIAFRLKSLNSEIAREREIISGWNARRKLLPKT